MLCSSFDNVQANSHNGYEKFYASTLKYYQFSKDYPNAFNLLNYSTQIKTNNDNSPHFQEIMQLSSNMLQSMANAVELGKKDGSIRADLDSKMGAYTAVYISIRS